MEKLTFVDIPDTGDRVRGKHKWLFDALVEASRKGKALSLPLNAESRVSVTSIGPTVSRSKISKKLRRLTRDGKLIVWLVDADESVRKF